MPVQIAPLQPSNLAQVALAARSAKRQDRQLDQADRRIELQDLALQSRTGIQQEQLGLQREAGARQQTQLDAAQEAQAFELQTQGFANILNNSTSLPQLHQALDAAVARGESLGIDLSVQAQALKDNVKESDLGPSAGQKYINAIEQTRRKQQASEGLRAATLANTAAVQQASIANTESTIAARDAKTQREARDDEKLQAQAATTKSRVQDLATRLLAPGNRSALNGIYGAADSRTPTVRSESIEIKADVQQMLALLTLEERAKLKGQGTITDQEARTLADSVSILGQFGISEERAVEELQRIANILGDEPAAIPDDVTVQSRNEPTGRTATNPQTGQKMREVSPGVWEPI